jgi:AraC family transcriptional regulator, arabinose operon regulatory protein
MRALKQTDNPTFDQLLTGHFNVGADYATRRDHGTTDWLLIHTIDGRGRFAHRGGELLARPGDFALLAPGTVHDYSVESELLHWELLWVHFHPRPFWMDLLRWPECAPGLMNLTASATATSQLTDAFHRCHALATSSRPRRDALAMNALEHLLLMLDEQNPRSHQRRPIDQRVQAAMDFMCRHLGQRLSIDDIADHCGLSSSRLAHLFREQTGTTPQKFLEAQRLDRARQLLSHTQLSIKQVAAEVGFESQFYFSLRFKRMTGKNPSAFRMAFV